MSEKWLYFRCYQSEYFQSASFNRFQMSDIVKFGENISIIQKRATFEKISILEVYYRWQASGGRKCAVSCRIFFRAACGNAECCAHHNPTFHREPFVRDAGRKLLTLLKCLCRGCSEVPHGGYEWALVEAAGNGQGCFRYCEIQGVKGRWRNCCLRLYWFWPSVSFIW